MSTTTDWVLSSATVLTLSVATSQSTPAIVPITGPGEGIEQVVQEVSLAFDLDAELAPWFAASEETIRLLGDLE